MKLSARSTREASRHRRCGLTDQMSQLRDLLPATNTSRLSQLHILTLSHSYIATNNFFNQFVQSAPDEHSHAVINEFDFISCLPGFLLITQLNGKLLYVSENVSNYIGYSMVDVLTQLDSLYDMINKQDHDTLKNVFHQSHSSTTTPVENSDTNLPAVSSSSQVEFICRMHFGRISRRCSSVSNIQSLEKDKTMLVRGYLVTPMMSQTEAVLPSVDGCYNQPILVAMCTPHLSVLDSSIDNNNNNNNNNNVDSCLVFRSVHSLDMKFISIDSVGRRCLGYYDNVRGESWYQLIHSDDIQEALKKHLTLVKSVNVVSRCALCLRVQPQNNCDYIWLHVIMSLYSNVSRNNNSDIIDDFNDVTDYKSWVVCYSQVIDARDVEVTRLRDNVEESELQVSVTVDNPLLPTVVANECVMADLGELSHPVTRAEVMYRLRKKMKHCIENNDQTLSPPPPPPAPSLPSVPLTPSLPLPSVPSVSLLPIPSCSSVYGSIGNLNIHSIPSPPLFPRPDLPSQSQATCVTPQSLIPVMVDEETVEQLPADVLGHSRNVFGSDNSEFEDSSYLPFYPQNHEDGYCSFLQSPFTLSIDPSDKSSFQSSEHFFTQFQTQASTIPPIATDISPTITNIPPTCYASTNPTSAVPQTFTNFPPEVDDLPELDFDAVKTFFMNPCSEMERMQQQGLQLKSSIESYCCLPYLNHCQGLDVDYLEKLLLYGEKMIVNDEDSLAAMPQCCCKLFTNCQ